ncbi:MAG: hypothetical protein FJX72_03115, partial [Armatimonadetes bacterium]|nr:hypothetical protein [Armatimonadota bacterium]
GFMREVGLDSERPYVALLPGSRRAELAHNSGAMADAAHLIRARRPGVQFVSALAAGAESPAPLRRLTDERDAAGRSWGAVVVGKTYNALSHASAAIVCSGTATLESAILGVPMVIVYRGSRLMHVEYTLRRIARIEHIGLPNIIAGKRIVPELVADAGTPQAMAEHALRYLENPEQALEVRRELASVREALGEPGASRRTASMVVELARRAADGTQEKEHGR